MKRLLLIDDEEMARQHIKEAFPWEAWGYTIVGEATNGVEALASVEALSPDIALVDITMPVMDGLTLLRQLTNKYPRTKCVILTAHREFSYIKQAMENGAVGYMLKSPINLVETKEALDRASKESERDVKALAASQNQKTIQSNSYPLRKHFFQQLLTGVYAADHEIIQCAQDIGLHLHHTSYLLFVLEAERFSELHEQYASQDRVLIEFSMLEIIRESLQESFHEPFELLPLELGRLVLLVGTSDKVLSRDRAMAICMRLEQVIQPPLAKYLDMTMKLACSESFHTPHHIRSLFRQVDGLLIYRFYQDRPKTIFAYAVRPFHDLSPAQWQALAHMAVELGEVGTQASYKKTLDKIQALFIQYSPSPAEAIRWFQSLELQLHHADFLPPWPSFGRATHLAEALKMLEDWLLKRDRIVVNAIEVRPEIARAIQYIRLHLGEELIVDAIAAESGLSTSHFSHIFKKEMGMSVIDYVLEQRIELAKQYLAEGKFRNYELSEKVGFQHYSYFSNIFKKMTGMSPNDYKRSVKNVITHEKSLL
ncbi:response regulator transcription factor [Paenibacillus ferrarius]|uniref:response regulator transcription factor n=1 Tax=Paenibacillus ferrarius TaxID=1469647 RepID=UPI003D2B46B4